MTRRGKATCFGILVGCVTFVLYMSTRLEDRQRLLKEYNDQFLACQQLFLGNTHDEVIHVLGSPAKEYKEENGAVTVMQYNAPRGIPSKFPRVKLERGLLVEADCSSGIQLVATAQERAAMAKVLEFSQQLGKDAIRP